jgi:hypothetical protein
MDAHIKHMATLNSIGNRLIALDKEISKAGYDLTTKIQLAATLTNTMNSLEEARGVLIGSHS